MAALSSLERLLQKTDRSGDCWLWTGWIDTSGYGRFEHRGAHRRAYELLVGPIPEGLTIDHLCRVRHCVNPSHLEPVTKTENIRRGISPSAQHARQTHCVNGHPFDERNTYRDPTGKRCCRVCVAAAQRRYQQRKKAIA